MSASARPLVRRDSPLAGGTRVRRDGYGGGWVSTEIGIGGLADPVSRATFQPSIQLPQVIVDALLQFSGIAHRLASREPYDCTREGFTLGSDPVAERLAVAAVQSITGRTGYDSGQSDGVLVLMRKARTWARAYGGGGIVVMADDGRKPHEPLDRANIRRITGARVVNRWELIPISMERDPLSPRCGLPTLYQVTLAGVGASTVHHTRVVVFQGMELPESVMARQQGWGGSVYDLAWDAMKHHAITMAMLPNMARRLSQGVYTMQYLEDGIAADLKSQMISKFEAQSAAMSVIGDMAIGEGEKYEVLSRTVAGVKELVEPLERNLVANADGLPKLLLYGDTPGGIRSGDNPEITAWYDTCSSRQTEHYTPPLLHLLELLALSHEGPTGGQVPRLEVTWLPLYQSSQQEIDASELSRAQRRALDLQGTITTEEARTDPDVVRLYQLQPGGGPAAPGIEPANADEAPLDDADEALPVVSADPSKIPPGEALIGIRRAARDLGRSPGSLMRDAMAGRFPIWRDGSRWKVAMSLVKAATTPHEFAPPAAEA